MVDVSQLPLWANAGLFLLAAAIIGGAGVALSGLADRIADRSGLGEAITGGVLLGASTSLSGSVTSITAALRDFPELAISNAVGGIAAQTVFLVIADACYRRANLEHAAASVVNLTQGALLVSLLSVPLIATSTPELSVLGVHPATVALLAGYGFGVRLTAQIKRQPMWGPEQTPETREDVPDEPPSDRRTLAVLALRFTALALVLAVAGYAVAETGIAIAQASGLSQTLVGSLLTAVATSLPELVTTIAAVRRGALTLAVGGIIGGNTFDVLFIAFSDVAYRGGSVYHAIPDRVVFLIALTILMTAILLLGLIRRERYGFGNIGFESLLVLLSYGLGIAVITWAW